MRSLDANTPGVTVSVNGRAWRMVESLAGVGPRDRVFVVSQTSSGATVLQFGDGLHGARPPAGGTIAVGYRTGGGAGGNAATVSFKLAATEATLDPELWVVIRYRTRAISFEFRERRQSRSRKTLKRA